MLFNNFGGKLFFSKTSFRKKNKTTKKPSKPLQKNKRKKKINTETKKTTPS